MAFSADALKPPPHDQVAEMQCKIQLVESDRAAYYEGSQSAIEQNTEYIRQLKQENERLAGLAGRCLASQVDENIKDGFHKEMEKDAYHDVSRKAALTALDQKMMSKMKHLNALKHSNQTLQSHIEGLKMAYQKSEGSGGAQSADSHTLTLPLTEEGDMKLRALENSLEKTHFKCKEAENITTNYEKLKSHLQEESLYFQDQLDSLEAEILKYREELCSMQVMNSNAQLSKEAAKVDLQQQEEVLFKERKEREGIVAGNRKNVEERKAQAEKVDRRAQRTTMQPDELSSEAQHSSPRVAGEEEKAIFTIEEAFQCIEEATGITDIQEIAERFMSQNQTHQHLEKLKEENKNLLQQLKEQKKLLNQQFQDMKYSGEAKLSSDQQMLEECEQQLQAQQLRCDAGKERLECFIKALSTIRAGVELLAGKLRHIRLSEDTVAEVSPDSDEFVMELLTQCELKLQLLHEELRGEDVAAIMKEIEEQEFNVRFEGKLPTCNTGVKLLEDQRLDLFDEEDNSEEDEANIISREALKRQSQLIIDSKSKKKPWKKKGKF